MSEILNVEELIELIQGMLKSGEITKDTVVHTQGCDCVGPCDGVYVDEEESVLVIGREGGRG